MFLVMESMIGYPNYKFYFPIRALGKYERTYLPWTKESDCGGVNAQN